MPPAKSADFDFEAASRSATFAELCLEVFNGLEALECHGLVVEQQQARHDDDLHSTLDADESAAARRVLEALIAEHEARRRTRRGGPSTERKMRRRRDDYREKRIAAASSAAVIIDLAATTKVTATGFATRNDAGLLASYKSDYLHRDTRDDDRETVIMRMVDDGFRRTEPPADGSSIIFRTTTPDGKTYNVWSAHGRAAFFTDEDAVAFEAAITDLHEHSNGPGSRVSMNDCRIIGHTRAYKAGDPRTTLLAWVKKNAAAVARFVSNRQVQAITAHLNILLEAHHGKVYAYYKERADAQPDDDRFFWGVFSCCSINFPTVDEPFSFSCPHRDVNNVTLLCALFAFGDFPSGSALLILYDVGHVHNFRPYTFVILPSSLLYHGNCGARAGELLHFDIVDGTTPSDVVDRLLAAAPEERGELGRPWRRGSLAWYNQGRIYDAHANGGRLQSEMAPGKKAKLDWLSLHEA